MRIFERGALLKMNTKFSLFGPTPQRAWLRFSMLLGGLMLLILSLEAIWSADIAAQRARYKAQALVDLLDELPQINVASGQLVSSPGCAPNNANAAGYSLRRVSAEGYAGLIEIHALIDETGRRELKLAGFASHSETPGFVDRLSRNWFRDLVRDLNDGHGVDALSGATISSQAVIDALLYCFAEL